jgi:hypothetical protein
VNQNVEKQYISDVLLKHIHKTKWMKKQKARPNDLGRAFCETKLYCM